MERCFDVNFEGAQVTIIDADDLRAGVDGAPKLVCIVDFHQRRHAEGRGELAEVPQFGIREDGDDQKDGVCAMGRGLDDLRLVDSKVLAQDRNASRPASGLQVLQTSLKEFGIGEHRQSGRTAILVRASYVYRIVVRCKEPFAGRRFLQLGDDRGPGLPQRLPEISPCCKLFSCLQFQVRKRLENGSQFASLTGDDTLQDGRDGGGHLRIQVVETLLVTAHEFHKPGHHLAECSDPLISFGHAPLVLTLHADNYFDSLTQSFVPFRQPVQTLINSHG